MNVEHVLRRRLPWLIVTTVLIGVAGLALVAERDMASAHDLENRSHSRDVALAVARSAAVAFTSYDYRHLDKSFARLRAVATNDFYQQFLQAADQLTPLILGKKASSAGKVVDIAIQDEPGRGSAMVLVAADATVRNTDVPQGAVQRFRLRIALTQVDRGWRVKAITPVV